LIAFYWGGLLAYANVKTLSDLSMKNCQGDLKSIKPTVMVGVAAVWENLKKGVLGQVNKQPPLTQKLFWAAYHYKLKSWKIPGSSYLIDNLIFKKVKAATGGRLKYVLNGGSPLSKDTQVFISNLLAPVLIGYGLTETVANTTVVDPRSFEYDVQGALSGAITVKLIDVPEAGYEAKNDQGEVLIRGLPVTSEYYKNDEENSKAFDSEGWFKTGDIGEWTPTGQLKIIDRKKNLVKTLNGEYIALEKLESVYRSNSNVCCYADQNRAKPIAIIFPHEQALKQLAFELKLLKSTSEEVHADMLRNRKLTNAVLKSLLSTAKSHGLNGIELIQGLVFVEEEWTPQNGFVTSAQKLQRKKILEANKDLVDAVYEETS
jgi:long-chain acyl-CoA synthetase